MKPKISPEDYRNILKSLELNTLYISDLISKLNEENISSNLTFNVGENYTYKQEGNTLNVLYTYKLNAKDEEKEVPAISITAKFTVLYNLTKEVQITKDFMKVFSDLTLGMLLWTYFRELVNNLVYRMGMPPLVLPLKKK